MRDRPILTILRGVAPLAATDTLGRAAESLRVSGVAELPVLDSGRLAGTVGEASILSALVGRDGDLDAAAAPVESVMKREVLYGSSYMTVGQVATLMDVHGAAVLPIIDDYGRYLGIVTRSDVAGALTMSIRPPSIAGMATPLGVYLTTGHIRAGAGDLGLFLAGVSLMLLNYLAIGSVVGLAWVIEHATGIRLWTALNWPGLSPAGWMDTARTIMMAMSVPLFLVLLRMAPLSGYHAAEHQVVHAIEHGEPLSPDIVQRMPRVHPRCGTNIVAAVVLFMLIAQAFGTEIVAMVTIFVMIFAWRSIGAYVQNYVTTKPATPNQLMSGIRAGESLLARYRENPAFHVTGWRRFWNTGMPQVMLGAAVMMSIGELLHPLLPTVF